MKLSPLKVMLLAAVAAATLAEPIAAAAQPAPDRTDREQTQAERKARQEARQKQKGERPARQTPPAGKADPVRPNRPDRPAADRVRPNQPVTRPDRVRPNQPDRARPNQTRPDRVNPDRVRPDRTRPDRTPPTKARPNQPQTAPVARRPLTPERQRVRRNAQTQIQRGFNRDRWQQDFRRRHSDRRWWRNDRNFRGWNGVRVGFYFAPGYGYYSVPRSYYNQRYYAGSYLPSYFWRYRVNSHSYWGLPPAPPGTAWIHVNNAILLVDLWDGYIITAIYDVWSW